jgi:type I restriction enzyme, S subunit
VAPPSAVFASYLILGRPKDPSIADWLAYFIRSTDYLEQIRERAAGIGLSNVSASKFSSVSLPIPPLSEQRRIVAKLDSLTGRTARAREELWRIPRLVERYKQALLTAAFQDGFGIENVASYFVPQPLSTAVISTFYGPRIAREAYVSSGIPTLRTTDIGEWGRLCLQDPPQVNVGQQERSKWAFRNGDLMVTRTGATIGKCAVYEDRFGPALPSAYLIRVRFDLQILVPRFVLLFLLSPKGQRQLLDGRTAVAQPNINANAILPVELPLLPIELQKSIVSRIETAFTWLDRITAEH